MSAGLFGSCSVIQINPQLQPKITPKYFNSRSTSESLICQMKPKVYIDNLAEMLLQVVKF